MFWRFCLVMGTALAVSCIAHTVQAQAPVFEQANYTFELDENQPVRTVVGRVRATDSDSNDPVAYFIEGTTFARGFTINVNTGVIRSKIAFNYEGTKVRSGQISATDNDGNSVRARITVNIGDANDPGQVKLSATGARTYRQGFTIVAEIDDPELECNSYEACPTLVFIWERSRNLGVSWVSIVNDLPPIGFRSRYRPGSADVGPAVRLRVRVQYIDTYPGIQIAISEPIIVLGMSPPSFRLILSTTSLSEGGGSRTISARVVLDDSFPEDHLVDFTVAGSGVEGRVGFTINPATSSGVPSFTDALPLPMLQAGGSFTLTPQNDNLFTEDEVVTVTAQFRGTLLTESAEIRIVNDDPLPITLRVHEPDSVREGFGRVFAVTASFPDGRRRPVPTVITLSVADGTAIEGMDFRAGSSVEITIPRNNSSVLVRQISLLDVIDDELVEGTETVTLSGTSAGGLVEVLPTTIDILDSDMAMLTLVAPDMPVRELTRPTSVEIVATLDNPVEREFQVTVSTTSTMDDTAIPGRDYTSITNRRLTFPDGNMRQTFRVFILDDPDTEREETFHVSLGSVVGRALPVRFGPDAIVRIRDDDDVVMTWADSEPVREGMVAVLTATLHNPVPGGFTLPLVIEDITATGGSDYTPTSVTLSFDGGPAETETFEVTVHDDAVVESLETFRVFLGNPLLTPAPAPPPPETALNFSSRRGVTVIILDIDMPPDTIILSLTSPEVDEEKVGTTTVTVMAVFPEGSPALQTDTEVTVTVGADTDSATKGVDYTAVEDFTVTIRAGATSGEGTFLFEVTDDAVVDPGETVTVSGTADGFSFTGTALAITDNDTATVTLGAASVSENRTRATVTATLNAAVPRPFTVDVSTADGSAVAGSDYTAVIGRSVGSFSGNPGETVTFDLDLMVMDDNIYEGSETLALSGLASVPYVTVLDTTLTIIDNERRPQLIFLTVDPDEIGEADRFDRARNVRDITVTATYAIPQNVVLTTDTRVNIATSLILNNSGNPDPQFAIPGQDYIDFGTIPIVIPAGMISGSATFKLEVIDDGIVEGPEIVFIRGSASTFQVDPAPSLIIIDGIPTGVSISDISLMVTEGGVSQSYEIALNRAPTGSVIVSIDLRGSTTAPITVTPRSLSFNSTNWETARTITVTATEDDDAIDGTRTLEHLVIGYGDATATTVTVTVTDNDTAGVTISPTTLTVTEEGPAATYTVVLDSAPAVSATVTIATGSSTTAPITVDPASRALIFSSTNWNMPQTVTVVATEDDDAVGGTRTLSHTVSGYPGVTDVADVTVTVTDNDTAGVTISPTTLTVTEEGPAATYTVVLDSAPAVSATVTIATGSSTTAPITVDPASRALIFSSTNWNMPQTVTVVATEDDDAVGGTRTLVHTVTSYSGVTSADAADVTVTVNDNDTAPTEIVLRLSPDGAEEGAGPTVTVTAAFPGSVTLTDATVVTIAVGTGTDSATEGTDYATVADLTVTIEAGATSGEGTFLFAVTDDEIADPDETVTVSGTTTAAGFTTITSATLTITDNDTAGVTIDPTTLTVEEEGEAATYTVVLDSDPDGTVVVAIDSGSSTTAPITVTPTSLSFNSTDWGDAQTVTVVATEDDDAVGGTRTLVHTVTSYSGVTSADAADVTVTVNDENTAPTEIVLRLSPDGAEEGAGPTVTVTAAFPGSVTLTDATVVTIAVGAGTDSATEGTDYTEVADLTVTIEAGATSGEGTFLFAVMDDAIADPDETVTVSGTTTAAGFTTITSATLTITDNDTAGVTIAPTTLTVEEEGPAATYTVVLDSDPDGTVVVAIDSGSSTTAPITVTPTSLSFNSTDWGDAQTVTVVATEDDDAVGGTRTLVHTVSSYSGVTSADAADVTVTVNDDDTAPTEIVLRLSQATPVVEGDDRGGGRHRCRPDGHGDGGVSRQCHADGCNRGDGRGGGRHRFGHRRDGLHRGRGSHGHH